MAHVPIDDIQELWNWTPQHNWSALHKTLQEHVSTAQGISNNLVEAMLHISEQEQQAGHKYPESPKQLYDLMNSRIEKDYQKLQ